VLDSALIVRGNDASRLGDQTSARAEFAEARGIAERLGDRAAAVRALRSDAEVVRQQGDLETAKQENNDALAVANEIGDRRDQVNILLNLSQVYRPEGNLPKQKEYAERSLQLARELGDKTSQGSALLNLGNILNNMGDPDAGRAAYQQCAEIARQISDKQLLAKVTGNLGILDYTHGKLDSGRSLLEQGLALSRQTGEKSSVAYKLGHYSTVLLYQDHLDQARAAARENCDIQTSLGEKLNLASCQLPLADLAIQQGRPGDAIAPLTAITAAYKTQNPALKAWMLLAEAQLELGNVAAAKAAVDQAQVFASHTVNEQDFHIPLGYIGARVLAAQGQDAAALKQLQALLARADALKLFPMELRIRLAIAEIRMKSRPAEGIRLAQAVESDARGSGFVRLAANAQRIEARQSVARK
jgi:tetratricopeptide (TPR) repeat protein